MNYIKLFEDFESDYDGDKYFDFTSLERFGAFENPIYFMLEKGKEFKLLHISPDSYLSRIAIGFGGLSRDDLMAAVNMNLVHKYANDMKRGDKFPIGYYTLEKPDQEGRHRALACKELGVTSMPVIEIINLTKRDTDNLAIMFNKLSTEELNSYLKENGYNEASSLDIRTIKNYIEYKL